MRAVTTSPLPSGWSQQHFVRPDFAMYTIGVGLANVIELLNKISLAAGR